MFHIPDPSEIALFHALPTGDVGATVVTHHGSECLSAENGIPLQTSDFILFGIVAYNDVIHKCGGQKNGVGLLGMAYIR